MTRNTFTFALAATLALAGSALASPLGPGTSISTSGTNALSSPHAYGTMIHNQVDNFNIVHSTGALLFQGKLESLVFQNSAGELTFDLQVIDSEAGLNGIIGSIGRNGFSGWDTDVDWRADAMGLKDPFQASRTLDGNKVEWKGPWTGSPGIFSGETSRMLFVSTDAEAFAPNAAIARVTLTTGEFVDIEVAAPVPAPGAMALLGLAGCVVGSRRRRRA
ncbi:MAG: PEP-CTERM sorting domain-containing protein [Planctomycetota bacterium]|nr:PEP-CTERM sorting domain-containing protein [Planctomycetota bacterium]